MFLACSGAILEGFSVCISHVSTSTSFREIEEAVVEGVMASPQRSFTIFGVSGWFRRTFLDWGVPIANATRAKSVEYQKCHAHDVGSRSMHPCRLRAMRMVNLD